MRHNIPCLSGLKGWQGRLHENYTDFDPTSSTTIADTVGGGTLNDQDRVTGFAYNPAGLLAQQVAVQDRAVEAAIHGDRQAALQALLLDPVVPSYEAAVQILDELLVVHAPYLPQFLNEALTPDPSPNIGRGGRSGEF
jgi:hypothetical protein